MLTIRVPGGTEYPLPLLDAATTDLLTSWYDNGKWPELVSPAAECVNTPDPPYKVGSLFWPVVGASRFARAVLAIDSGTLGLLRDDTGSPPLLDEDGEVILDEDGGTVLSDSGNPKVILSYTDEPDEDAPVRDGNGAVLLDENGAEVTAEEIPREFPLYLIASRPVSRTADAYDSAATEHDLFLVTLVDRRWYWAHETGTGEAQSWSPDTWAELFTSLLAHAYDAAGATADTVEAAYDEPGAAFSQRALRAVPLAHTLDKAADVTGMRVVVTPDVVAVQKPTAANLAAATDFATANDYRRGGGGDIDTDDILAALPKVVFDANTEDEVELATGLAGARLASRALSSDALEQWADDWLAWQSPPLDSLYDGFTDVPASGFVGGVELYHDAATGYTRVSRPPLNWVPVGDCFGTSGTASASGGDSTCSSLLAMRDSWCLALEVLCATGEFANLSLTQTDGVFMRGSGGTWTAQTWDAGTSAWVAWDFDYVGGSGGVSLTFASDGSPVLTIDGLTLRPGTEEGVFSAGLRNGFSGDAGLAAALAPCDPSEFTVRVSCTCCPVDGWTLHGWYCDPDTETVHDYTTSRPCYGDHTTIEGPYDTEEEADAACGPLTMPCQMIPFGSATADFTNKTGDCTCLPDSATVTNTGNDECDVLTATCPGNIVLELNCVSGFYELTTATGGIVITPVSFAAGATGVTPAVLVFDVSGYGGNCGGSGGSARLTITAPY